MAEQIYNVKCGFFDAVNNDRVYTAEDMNRLYKRVIHDGVFPDNNNQPSTDLSVTSDSGMIITVNPGEGIFANRWFKNTIEIPIEVPANTSNNRIDSVIVQVDTRKSGRAGNIVYRTGEPSINPAPPQINEVLGVVEYRLANISVTSGATAITSADITDLRGTSECPWVTGIVSANDIPPNSVTEAKLATDAVTTAKIKNGAVTGVKIATGTIETTNIGVGQVQTANIDGGAVTNDKIDNRTITGGKLALATVDTSELANYAVDTMKLKSPCVNTVKLYDNAVTADKIKDGEVTTNKIADNSVNENKIQNGAVGYNKLSCATTSGNASQAWAFANDTTIPTTKLTKTWIENYTVDMLPSYSIGFNTDGIAVNKTTSTTMGAGTFLSGIKSIYLSENVTTLQDGFFNTASDLTDLYVDSDSVEMPTVPARVTVHNKGTFVVSDLLINSMIASNNEILDIKATIIQVNTQLENAINGVSE